MEEGVVSGQPAAGRGPISINGLTIVQVYIQFLRTDTDEAAAMLTENNISPKVTLQL